jgi:hypothetical protein
MNELKKILIKLLVLLADILLFGFNTVKQVVLPNRKRKGNLLSSLFIFFMGIIERLNCFEHGIFRTATFFKKKYVRQVIFIIGGILFLLSLFELTGDQSFVYSEATRYSEQLSSNEVDYTEAKLVKISVLPDKPERNRKPFYKPITLYNSPTFTTSVKKFLLVKCIRV